MITYRGQHKTAKNVDEISEQMGRKETIGGRTGSWPPQQVPVQSLGLGSSSGPDKHQILCGATKKIWAVYLAL